MSFPRSPGGNPGTFMVGHPDAFNNTGSPTEKIGDDPSFKRNGSPPENCGDDRGGKKSGMTQGGKTSGMTPEVVVNLEH